MNVEQVKAHFQAKVKAMNKAGIKTQYQAARLMMFTAKSLSPIFTGETINGIQTKKLVKGYVCESKVSGKKGFKQNMFANQTAPFRTIRFKNKGGSVFYGPNQNVVYGGNAYNWSGGPIKWSGTPQFFHIAYLRTREKYPSLLASNIKSALRVKT